jgi:hypothetical protein
MSKANTVVGGIFIVVGLIGMVTGFCGMVYYGRELKRIKEIERLNAMPPMERVQEYIYQMHDRFDDDEIQKLRKLGFDL